jgi:hydrogenase nickel incorporation protein HypA/HybF
MHELSLAENIIEIVEESAKKSEAKKVTKIVIDIGRLSGVERDALQFAMDLLMKGSVAEGAELELHDIEGMCHCLSCWKDGVINDFFSPCPHCNSHDVEIVAGKEMKVSSIEVEKD